MIADPLQDGMFPQDKTIEQKFAEWKETEGGRKVLELCHKWALHFQKMRREDGQGVSMKLIWENVRREVAGIEAQLRKQGRELHRVDGYALNNSFTALVARHILERHPEMEGLFEMRERNQVVTTRKVLVIEETSRSK